MSIDEQREEQIVGLLIRIEGHLADIHRQLEHSASQNGTLLIRIGEIAAGLDMRIAHLGDIVQASLAEVGYRTGAMIDSVRDDLMRAAMEQGVARPEGATRDDMSATILQAAVEPSIRQLVEEALPGREGAVRVSIGIDRELGGRFVAVSVVLSDTPEREVRPIRRGLMKDIVGVFPAAVRDLLVITVRGHESEA